jgi:hypothetical protein
MACAFWEINKKMRKEGKRKDEEICQYLLNKINAYGEKKNQLLTFVAFA